MTTIPLLLFTCLTHFLPIPSLSLSLTHQISHPRIFDDFHWSSLIISWALTSISRLNKLPRRPRQVLVRFSLFIITAGVVVMVREEEVGGAERDEMDLLEPYNLNTSAATSQWSVSIVNETLSDISQDEGMIPIRTCRPIP